MPIEIKLIAGALLLALAFIGGWQSNGWRINLDIAQRENAALQAARQEAIELKEKIRQLDAAGVKENEDAQRKINDLQRRIAAGELRLTVPVRCPARDPGDPGAVAGGARAELDPATSASLIAIAADGDQAIRDLTDLQKICVEIEKSCSKP